MTVVIVLASLLAGCHLRAPGGSPRRPTYGNEPAGNVVLRKELERAASGQTLKRALELTRPWFLLGRGASPAVSIDGSAVTDASVLLSIPVADVQEVRLLRAIQTTGRSAIRANGDVVIGDVLLVITRAR